MTDLVIILIVIVVLGGTAGLVILRRTGGTGRAHHPPAFTVHRPPAGGRTAAGNPAGGRGTPGGPGFTVITVTGGARQPPGRRTDGAARAAPSVSPFTLIGVTENDTAICKLTGKQIRDCSCDRHQKGGVT